jgi:hypothetical protein
MIRVTLITYLAALSGTVSGQIPGVTSKRDKSADISAADFPHNEEKER